MKKLVFFLQTNWGISEQQSIFWDLAYYISLTREYEVYYVNNMFDADLRKHAIASAIYITPEDIDDSFEDAIFFTPVNFLGNLLSVIKEYPNAKICLLSYSDQTINWLVNNAKLNKGNISKLLELFIDKNACAYKNYSSIFIKNEHLDYSDKIFIPQCVSEPISEVQPISTIVDSSEINFAYIGDIDKTALNILDNLFNNFCVQNLEKKVSVHIIGSINMAEIPLNFRKASNAPVRLILTGNIKDFEEKKQYVQENVDVVFASGSLALEASLYGVPVVVPISDEKKIIGNHYVYLFDANQYVYRWSFVDFLSLNNESHTLAKIINDIYYENKKEDLAQKCFEYVYNNASIEFASKEYFRLAQKTTLTVADCLSIDSIADLLSEYSEFCDTHEEYECDYNAFIAYKKQGDAALKKKD